jgi:ribosome recycling factor
MIEQLPLDTKNKMQKTLTASTHDLATIRTGRASSTLIEHIRVDYHGVPTPINQMASITVPEPKMIAVQPWDRSTIHEIEKAIMKSGLGLNPINDGTKLRLIIPQLTEERRKELIKVVHKKLEDTRIALRNIRRDAIELLRKAEKDKEISQDQRTRSSEQIQKLLDGFIDMVNDAGQNKEAEIMEV